MFVACMGQGSKGVGRDLAGTPPPKKRLNYENPHCSMGLPSLLLS